MEWLDDDQLMSAGFDGRLRITRAESGSKKKLHVVAKFEHDNIPIERVAFASDRTQFLTVSVRTDKATQKTDYELQLWSPDKPAPLRMIKPAVVGSRPARRIAAVNWSPDDLRVAAAVDGNLQIFDSQTWKITAVLEAPGLGVSDAVFPPQKSADGAEIIATFDGTSAHLWNLKDRSHVADFRPLFAIQATALSEDDQHPLLLTGDRAVQIFQADTTRSDFGRTLFKISDPHRGVITSLEFNPNGTPQTFVSGGADGSAALWQWDSERQQAKRLRWLCQEGAAIASTAWSPNGKSILLAANDGRIQLIPARDGDSAGREFTVSKASDVEVSTAKFSSDGRFFVVAGKIKDSGESRGWVFEMTENDEPELHCTIHGHESGGIRCCAFLPNSPYLVTGGRDGAGLIWNWQPARNAEDTVEAYEVYQLMVDNETFAHDAPINSLTVSASGTIATASDDGTAIVWHHPFRN